MPTKPTVKHSFEVGRVRSSGMPIDVVRSRGVQLCGQHARVVAHRGDDRRRPPGEAAGRRPQPATRSYGPKQQGGHFPALLDPT
eukprot:COSAG01_NODE_48787_length_378_cov_0.555556_1_plen_83_part_10